MAVDETGLNRVLETFFYHYYCLTDGKEYQVPEGVFTEKNGPVEGQDADAYLMADPIDPSSMKKASPAEASFTAPESPKEGIFSDKSDCRAYCLSLPVSELVSGADQADGSLMSVLAVAFSKAVQRVHPENTLPVRLLIPVSIREVMGNQNSLLQQSVSARYSFEVSDLNEKSDSELNKTCREFLKGFSSEKNIRMLSGVYRGICEGYTKAFSFGALDKITVEKREEASISFGVGYSGTLRTGDYGNRIRMTAMYSSPEKGIMLQATEVGETFYINWYQGFHDTAYICAMRDVLAGMGMKGLRIERAE